MTEFKIADSDLARIKDAVVLITGVSSGIGLATASLLLQHGARVAGGDLQTPPAALQAAPEFVFARCDVTVWTEQAALFDVALQRFGRIDHVFANAGIATSDEYLSDVLDKDGALQEPKHAMLAINLIGATNTVKLGIHHLRKNPSGSSIVINASVAAITPFPLPDYTASKHGVLGLMRSLAACFTRDALPLRINALAPHYTETAILPPLRPGQAPRRAQAPVAVARAALVCMVGCGGLRRGKAQGEVGEGHGPGPGASGKPSKGEGQGESAGSHAEEAHLATNGGGPASNLPHGVCVYVQDARFWEIDAAINGAVAGILPALGEAGERDEI